MPADIICVTNRSLCKENFLERIEKLARAHPAAIILREKDLDEEAYFLLAESVLEICRKNNTACILHGFVNAAGYLHCPALHLPLPTLRTMPEEKRLLFRTLGASCHSLEDAIEAQRLGCTYITAGHIFETDCKKGLPGRGLHFLREVCGSVSLPVYAIGGIRAGHMALLRNAKAAGACVMSGAMTCDDVPEYLSQFHT